MNAATEAVRNASPRPRARAAPRSGRSTGRCGASCGRTARSTSRRWSPAASSLLVADRATRCTCRRTCRCSSALDRRSGSAPIAVGVYGGDRRSLITLVTTITVVLLPAGCAARRAQGSQHPVLEVAAGVGHDDRAQQAVHCAGGRAGDRDRRDARRRSSSVLLLASVILHDRRREPGADLEQPAAVPADGRAHLLRRSRWRCGTRRSPRGCCSSRRGRSASPILWAVLTPIGDRAVRARRASARTTCRTCSTLPPARRPDRHAFAPRGAASSRSWRRRRQSRLAHARARVRRCSIRSASSRNPWLWVGLVVAAGLVAAAIWMRRYREPI